MVLDVSSGGGEECERFDLVTVLVEEVELRELYGWPADDGLDGELVEAVSRPFCHDSDGACVAQRAVVGDGEDDVRLSQSYGHDVSLCIDCGDVLIAAGVLHLHVPHRKGRVCVGQLQFLSGQQGCRVPVQGECLQGVRYVEVSGCVVCGRHCPFVAAFVDKCPSRVAGVFEPYVAAVEFPRARVTVGVSLRVVCGVDAVSEGIHLASSVEEEVGVAREGSAVLGSDVVVGGVLPALIGVGL